MVGAPQYAGRQKLYSGLLILACQPGPIDERLGAAYKLAISTIDSQRDIPPDFKSEFERMRDEMHREFVFQPGPTSNSRNQWAADMATRIVALYDKLARKHR